jgi:hypothetical protein
MRLVSLQGEDKTPRKRPEMEAEIQCCGQDLLSLC